MADTRGMSRRIKDAIVSILAGIEYEGETAFVSVLDNTKDEFTGYPSVRVLPSELSSSELDSADRDHAVEYAAIMHFPLNSPTDVDSEVYDRMYDLTDLIINTLELHDQDGGLSAIDPEIQAWLMSVPSARWYVGQSEAGALLLCNVTIKVRYSHYVA